MKLKSKQKTVEVDVDDVVAAVLLTAGVKHIWCWHQFSRRLMMSMQRPDVYFAVKYTLEGWVWSPPELVITTDIVYGLCCGRI
jgi:hypothetical protein